MKNLQKKWKKKVEDEEKIEEKPKEEEKEEKILKEEEKSEENQNPIPLEEMIIEWFWIFVLYLFWVFFMKKKSFF